MKPNRNRDCGTGSCPLPRVQAPPSLDVDKVRGGYRVLYIDPPWSFGDKGSRAAPDWKKRNVYQTLTNQDIWALLLPVAEKAARDSALFLWTTCSHLPNALCLMQDMDFKYKQTIVWVKRRTGSFERTEMGVHLPGPLQIGMGHYFRHAHELVLFGIRGHPKIKSHALPSVIEAPRSTHSRKPPKMRNLIEAAYRGPYLEVFATERAEGWASVGDQLPDESKAA